jgi:hypothetical protein
MTVNKQLNYEVRDSHGTEGLNKSVSVSFRVNNSAPKYLIHKAIVIQDRNRRQGTASCKTRSEVEVVVESHGNRKEQGKQDRGLVTPLYGMAVGSHLVRNLDHILKKLILKKNS